MGRVLFHKMYFHGGGNFFLAKFLGGLLYIGGTVDRITPKEGIVLLMHFPVIWTMQIWKFSPWRLRRLIPDQCTEFWKDLFLRLIDKGFKCCFMFSYPHVDPDLGYWYIIWKVNTRNKGLNWKIPFAHYASGDVDSIQSLYSFLISWSGHLHFDGLIIELH